MQKIVIDGGVSLKGEVSIGGAKNAALPIMAASILSSGENLLLNTPRLRDITTMGNLLTRLGIEFHADDNRVFLRTGRIDSVEAPYDLVKTMRASVLVLGPLLARMGEARIAI